MAAPQAPAPQDMPPMPSMMPMLVVMIMILGLYMIDGQDHLIGGLLDYVFGIFDFGGQYPVATLMLVGAIMVTLSTILRSFTTDMISQTKNQQIMNAFNQELRQARLDNNLYKVKKLTEMQPAMMAKNMEASSQMMKMMPYTMIIIIPIFLWIRYFVDVTVQAAGTLIIHVPWAEVSLLSNVWFFPAWILVYTLVSIPLGQVISRLIRAYKFKKRLKELESTEEVEVA
ncbi:MAG: DUF106 domain-containing protein [Thermoplasmata archaeon]|nr:DUF106 domain-containing protein [Thermoplasmata archaeon]